MKTTNNTGRAVILSCRLDLRTGDQGSNEDQDRRAWGQGSSGDHDLRIKVQDLVGYSVFGDDDLDDGAMERSLKRRSYLLLTTRHEDRGLEDQDLRLTHSGGSFSLYLCNYVCHYVFQSDYSGLARAQPSTWVEQLSIERSIGNCLTHALGCAQSAMGTL